MKKIINIYMAAALAAIVFLIAIRAQFYINDRKEPKDIYGLEQLEVELENDADLITITGKLPNCKVKEMTLGFYSHHQLVEVFAENQKIYELTAEENPFGRTPGSCWNFVTVPNARSGMEIEIQLRRVYKQIERIPEVYVGESLMLLERTFRDDVWELGSCMLILMIGIILLICYFLVKKRKEADKRLLYIGLFAIFMGIWSINEVSVFPLLVGDRIFSTYLCYTSMRLMMFPFILFTREMFEEKDHWIWKICCSLNLTDLALSALFQILGISDYRETLKVMYFSGIFFMFCTIFMMWREKKSKKIKHIKEMNVNFAGILLVLAGFLMDLFAYDMNLGYSDMMGRICFLAYILFFGSMTLRETLELANKGREAEIYHKLAFLDALTGMNNRTALLNHTDGCVGSELKEIQVFMIDLNNLKWCNDNLGHTVGDTYIIYASELLNQKFAKNAKIYRIGGDEFCVLTKGMSPTAIKETLKFFEENPIHVAYHEEEFVGRIACGFASYEEGDETVFDIEKRADAKMYEMKKKLKQAENGRYQRAD